MILSIVARWSIATLKTRRPVQRKAVKIVPGVHHENIYREWRYSSTHSLTSASWETSGELYAPNRFSRGENTPLNRRLENVTDVSEVPVVPSCLPCWLRQQFPLKRWCSPTRLHGVTPPQDNHHTPWESLTLQTFVCEHPLPSSWLHYAARTSLLPFACFVVAVFRFRAFQMSDGSERQIGLQLHRHLCEPQ